MESEHFFLIWNNGISYIEQILDDIRDSPHIKITRIFKRNINNLDHFIKCIYKLDKSLLGHIEEKVKYLKSLSNEIFIVFVKDTNTIYKEKGRNIFSYNINFTKWKIRLNYNPTDTNEKIAVAITDDLVNQVMYQINWPSHITHNHVIHSSDIEEETRLIKDYFNLSNESFSLVGNQYGNSSKYVKKLHKCQIIVNTTYQDHVDVKDTPHYKYLLGNYKTEYNEYINKHLGTIITYDNFSGAYDNLIANFSYGKEVMNEKSYIVCEYVKSKDKYLVLDGVHRLSILIHQGNDELDSYILAS